MQVYKCERMKESTNEYMHMCIATCMHKAHPSVKFNILNSPEVPGFWPSIGLVGLTVTANGSEPPRRCLHTRIIHTNTHQQDARMPAYLSSNIKTVTTSTSCILSSHRLLCRRRDLKPVVIRTTKDRIQSQQHTLTMTCVQRTRKTKLYIAEEVWTRPPAAGRRR